MTVKKIRKVFDCMIQKSIKYILQVRSEPNAYRILLLVVSFLAVSSFSPPSRPAAAGTTAAAGSAAAAKLPDS